jgi:hypothetical protein
LRDEVVVEPVAQHPCRRRVEQIEEAHHGAQRHGGDDTQPEQLVRGQVPRGPTAGEAPVLRILLIDPRVLVGHERGRRPVQ